MEEIKISSEALYLVYSLDSILKGIDISIIALIGYLVFLLFIRWGMLSESVKKEKEYCEDVQYRLRLIENEMGRVKEDLNNTSTLLSMRDKIAMISYDTEHLILKEEMKKNNRHLALTIILTLIMVILAILIPTTKQGVIIYVHNYYDKVNPEIFQYYLDKIELFVDEIKVR